MPVELREVELPGSNTVIRMTRTEVPDYINAAIIEAFERGRREALAEHERTKYGIWTPVVSWAKRLMRRADSLGGGI